VTYRFKVYVMLSSNKWQKLNAHGLPQWSDSFYYGLARVMAVLISTLFPSIAIIVLYFIQSLAVRLWVVLGFSMLFSMVIAIFTSARPIEIFAATAACASVQVVFVGSTKQFYNAIMTIARAELNEELRSSMISPADHPKDILHSTHMTDGYGSSPRQPTTGSSSIYLDIEIRPDAVGRRRRTWK
jgi:hypothetical protein